MSDYSSQIAAVIGSAPADLIEYYRAGCLPNYPTSWINCLPFDKARDYSQTMQDIPVVDRLGLWVLDDANDSNPFAYISKGPCAGMIIHFSHDREPEIAFSSLEHFLASMHDAGSRQLDIESITKEPINVSLDRVIRELGEEGTDDATFLINIYLPISAELQKETKECLKRHEDFFVRESLARFLAARPFSEDEMIAEELAADQHAQVARAGKAAVAAIKKMKYDPDHSTET